MFSKDIGIDLGTANVLIHVKGKGIVLNEPSVVAIDKKTNKVLAVGEEARQMVGRTPGNIVAIRPLKDGVIADFDVTEAMLKHFINKLNVKGFLSKPRILICCPTNITSVEQKAIREAAEKSGGKKVYLRRRTKSSCNRCGNGYFPTERQYGCGYRRRNDRYCGTFNGRYRNKSNQLKLLGMFLIMTFCNTLKKSTNF